MSILDDIKAQLKACPQLAPPLEMCDCCFERKPDVTSNPSLYATVNIGEGKKVLVNFKLCDKCSFWLDYFWATNVGEDFLTTAKIGECGG